jgi:uncharacterized protein (TIGR03083 family)
MGRSAASSDRRDATWRYVDSERLGLADLLDDLTDEEWETPSLCARWRIRDVVAHLALAHTGVAQAGRDLVRARGRLDVMIRDSAVRHARAPREQLVGQIRRMAGSRRRAPGVSYVEPLIDVLVHGQDIALPLHRMRPIPADAAVIAAQRVWTMPWPLSTTFRARSRLSGFELVADDADWSAGRGARVEGPIGALLMLLTGRTACLDRLAGPGAAELQRRLPTGPAG